MSGSGPLRNLLAISRELWDRDSMRPSVRQAFGRVLDCGTAALGAEVFASSGEERIVYHTCKSRACPSCGRKATVAWLRNIWRELPDVPYSHVCLTMPDVLWPLFRRNRHLLHNLSVLGARVIQQWVRQQYGVRLLIVVIPHTFGHHLNFNCHLHILVSQGGLSDDRTGWRPQADLKHSSIMRLWRYAVISYLREADRKGLLDATLCSNALEALLASQYARPWIIDIKRFQRKTHVLAYAGRYARRPPIAQHRFRQADGQVVRFSTKDTRTKRWVETTYSTPEFLTTLADHISDRGCHNVRYFGLLAPRLKGRFHDLLFTLLGQQRRGKPAPVRWARLIEKSFGFNPLVDQAGRPMKWVGRLPPSSH